MEQVCSPCYSSLQCCMVSYCRVPGSWGLSEIEYNDTLAAWSNDQSDVKLNSLTQLLMMLDRVNIY